MYYNKSLAKTQNHVAQLFPHTAIPAWHMTVLNMKCIFLNATREVLHEVIICSLTQVSYFKGYSTQEQAHKKQRHYKAVRYLYSF